MNNDHRRVDPENARKLARIYECDGMHAGAFGGAWDCAVLDLRYPHIYRPLRSLEARAFLAEVAARTDEPDSSTETS